MEIAHETSHLYRWVFDYANTSYSIYVENILYISRYKYMFTEISDIIIGCVKIRKIAYVITCVKN